ncbi:MAG: hypothetical protein N2D54_00225 [Chloroflexota bacterium]
MARKSLYILFLFVLLTFAGGNQAQAAAPEAVVAPGSGISPAAYLRPDGSLGLVNGVQGNFNLAGYNVTLDPVRGPLLSKNKAANPLYILSNIWKNIAKGANFPVLAVATDSKNNIYVGGSFSFVKDKNGASVPGTYKVAKRNGYSWSALGQGPIGSVLALAVDSKDNVYVGGDFLKVRDKNFIDIPNTRRIAKWNGSKWSAVGRGVNGKVNVIAIDGNDKVYVGGWFTAAKNSGGSNVAFTTQIAKWNGTSWSALGRGASANVRAIHIKNNNEIYVGGAFINVYKSAGGSEEVRYIAKWTKNTNTWSRLGCGGDGVVESIDSDGSGNIYVGGTFTHMFGNCSTYPVISFTSRIAMWNGSWSAMGRGAPAAVYAVRVNDYGTVLIGGAFDNVFDNGGLGVSNTKRLARWTGTWSAVGRGATGQLNGGIPSNVSALAFNDRGDMIVGGNFANVIDSGGSPVPNTPGIAIWDFPTGIFTDGFESGNLGAWSNNVNKTGEISVEALCKLCVQKAGALLDTYSLKVKLLNNQPHYVVDATPAGVSDYYARFYIKVAGLNMANLNKFRVFEGRKGSKAPFYLEIRKKGTGFQIRGAALKDGGGFAFTNWTKLPKSKTPVSVDWRPASSNGADNGYIKLFINGKVKVKKLGLDNDTLEIFNVRLGITKSIKPAYTMSGFFLLDHFDSDWSYHIGK